VPGRTHVTSNRVLARGRRQANDRLRSERRRDAHASKLVFLRDKAGPRFGGTIIGDLFSLLAAFFYASYNMSNNALLSRHPALVVMDYALTIGGISVIRLS
jgi:drug/metabolite transporter (DMT)-like permease